MKRPPPITELAFMQQVTELAVLCGWEWFHPRPGRTLNGWRTPGSGTMAKGWPDLVLVRGRDRRLIFAELKRDDTRTTADQDRVLDVLRELTFDRLSTRRAIGFTVLAIPRIEVVVWRPKDWPVVEKALR